uniref:Exostosin-2 n=1 Tax=Plectus sambesii TaxID=2011161 RepID=A0A914W8V3_9BILA
MKPRRRRKVCAFAFILCALTILLCTALYVSYSKSAGDKSSSLADLETVEVQEVVESAPSVPSSTLAHRKDCSLATCFNIYQCGQSKSGLSVYVHPLYRLVDVNGTLLTPPPSREFLELRSAIIRSRFFEPDEDRACLFLPGVDTLSVLRFDGPAIAKALAHHGSWKSTGANHLIFNLLTSNDLRLEEAIVAGGNHRLSTFRRTLDIAVPTWNPLTRSFVRSNTEDSRVNLAAVNLRFASHSIKSAFFKAAHNRSDVFLLDTCPGEIDKFDAVCDQRGVKHSYPHVLQTASFCVVVDGVPGFQATLLDSLQTACIPLILSDDFVLPFGEVLDWKRFSVKLLYSQLPEAIAIVADKTKFDEQRISLMRRQAAFIWDKYMKSMSSVALTTLRIFEHRLFADRVDEYHVWNEPIKPSYAHAPLFFPRSSPNEGFTAVVLAYERVTSLFAMIRLLSNVPSLTRIVVIWNNPASSPPALSDWPRIAQPIRVIRSKSNRLSNRFKPYDAIKTEAVLSLDDDITMLTVDEIEFAYQVWREHPDRLVGFPSRVHLYNPISRRLEYNSEWTNNVSMILTGAAFYHKYYGSLYQSVLPARIKRFVDERMNCEDIAMNFLIANLTSQPALKVTPRKRFLCPGCPAVGISADSQHLQERSECIDFFSNVYGYNPLRTVEFRVDPVLYKSPHVPYQMKEFPAVGQF